MKISKTQLIKTIKEVIKEETQYQTFFKKALKKFGASSPDDFESEEKKKEFFDYVDNNWESEDEKSESVDEDAYDRERDARAMGYRNAKEADKDNWGRPKRKKKKESYNEDTEYQKFFRKAMKKFGVEEPDELDKEKKKEFFNYVDKHWQAKDERKESIKQTQVSEAEFKHYVRMIIESQLREDEDPCWDDYEQIGMKTKNGKEVPNCVPKEGVSEAGEEKAIATQTGTRADAVKKFIEKHNLDGDKLLKWIKGASVGERMDFVSALVGKPGNKIQRKILKKFGKKLAEDTLNETHWINPQAQQKFARKFKTKKSKLKFFGFPKGDKTPSGKVISGKVELPSGEVYKIDVNWKKGEIVNSVKESVKENINETKFFVWYKKKKHEVEADSLYKAKKKFIDKHNVPKSQQSKLAIKSAGSMDKGDFRFS